MKITFALIVCCLLGWLGLRILPPEHFPGKVQALRTEIIGEDLSLMDTSGKTIQERFRTPESFVRTEQGESSFGHMLRSLPLKKHGSPVLLFNGTEKYHQHVHAAVIAMDPGKYDLQQCADAVMRLRAEYLFRTAQFSRIHFNFTSGHKCDYSQWADGYRPKVEGNKVTFSRQAQPDRSYANFNKYLQTVFTYAGSLSLSKEMKKIPVNDIAPGDVFIRGGSPGHAVIVVDVARDEKSGKKLFMLAQSYMPAQEIHILKNLNNEAISPWYEADFTDNLQTPEWTFEPNELMRF